MSSIYFIMNSLTRLCGYFPNKKQTENEKIYLSKFMVNNQEEKAIVLRFSFSLLQSSRFDMKHERKIKMRKT